MPTTTIHDKTSVATLLLVAFLALLAPVNASGNDRSVTLLPLALDERTLPQLRVLLDLGLVDSEQLVRFYFARMSALDDSGPRVNAMLDRVPDALERAREIDRHRHEDGHGPLYGIPFVVKDNIDVAGLPTSAGSMVLKGAYPQDSAHLVQRLQAAGAILLGKANMTELAASYGQPGYSSRGGITRNPWRLDRSVLGSSSGPAAAVAAGFAPFAIATDTEGSARGPAHATGLVTMRPTLGRISRDGIMPLAMSFDTPAPLTRTVTGNAWVLAAMAGRDDDDSATGFNAQSPFQLRRALRPPAAGSRPLEGVKLGVIAHREMGNREIEARLEQVLERIRTLGGETVRAELNGYYQDLWPQVVGPVHEAEFEPQLARYLEQFGDDQPDNLSELMALCKRFNSRAVVDHPIKKARIKGMERRLDEHMAGSAAYLQVVSRRIPALREELAGFMRDNDLDALIFPTEACPAPPLKGERDQPYECSADTPFSLGYIASATGFPELSLPMGLTRAGVPINFSLLGTARREARLYGIGQAFMQALSKNDPLALPGSAAQRLDDDNGEKTP
ncbi:amidase family protein [Kushneria aurantia]|uniref:Amidase family protein n=1 Tax=Kushneria aurantia TaxID=504092 RepID=A0ABV6G7B9_9GAMM|nr:amidase family protein [Kushneria aurantia]